MFIFCLIKKKKLLLHIQDIFLFDDSLVVIISFGYFSRQRQLLCKNAFCLPLHHSGLANNSAAFILRLVMEAVSERLILTVQLNSCDYQNEGKGKAHE